MVWVEMKKVTGDPDEIGTRSSMQSQDNLNKVVQARTLEEVRSRDRQTVNVIPNTEKYRVQGRPEYFF